MNKELKKRIITSIILIAISFKLSILLNNYSFTFVLLSHLFVFEWSI